MFLRRPLASLPPTASHTTPTGSGDDGGDGPLPPTPTPTSSSSSSPRRCGCCSMRLKGSLVLLTLLGVSHFLQTQILTPLPPLTLPKTEPWNLPTTQVSAMVFFKEESQALLELILHLVSQGFAHIDLVDNLSEHALPLDVLTELQARGWVSSLTHDPQSMNQRPAYRGATQRLRWRHFQDQQQQQKQRSSRSSSSSRSRSRSWVMPVDADEFPWTTQVGSLVNYLALQDSEVCSIAIPFHMFGSDGREDQPNSLLQGFVGRQNHTQDDHDRHPPGTLGYKTVSRLSCTLWAAIHHAGIVPRHAMRGYAATTGFPRNSRPLADARGFEIGPPEVVVNHYRSQSHQFYLKIKQTRGRGNNNGKVRDEAAFQSGDHNDTLDYSLARKARQRFPALYEQSQPQPQSQQQQQQQQHHPTSDTKKTATDDLALEPNTEYTSPWPMANVLHALDQLERHQVLVILDADTTLPDALAKATRNAAILDPTLDCLVRVAPGRVESVLGSRVSQLCQPIEAHPETQADFFKDFVPLIMARYRGRYRGFVAMDLAVTLRYGADTTRLRTAAIRAARDGWTDWHDENDNGNGNGNEKEERLMVATTEDDGGSGRIRIISSSGGRTPSSTSTGTSTTTN